MKLIETTEGSWISGGLFKPASISIVINVHFSRVFIDLDEAREYERHLREDDEIPL